MIRTIMLTHQYTDAITSAIVCLFFRMAGIYVVEKYLDFNVDLRAEMIELGIRTEKSQDSLCDAEIALFSRQSKRMEYLKNYPDKDRFVDICYEDYLEDVENDVKTHLVLTEILRKLRMIGVLDENQYSDLSNLMGVFISSDYVRTIMFTKYTSIVNEERWTDIMIERYRRIVRGLQNEELTALNEERACYHTKFAIINMAYEANYYCTRNGRTQIYSNREIIDIANVLKAKSGNLLDRSIETLLSQVDSYLLKDRSSAYQRMTALCRTDISVNSYIFFLKGKYWFDEGDYECASKYFAEAIARFPQYYRAWYQFGLCFYKQGKVERARKAFSNVIKILMIRYEGNILRPMEIEYLYNSCVLCGTIQERYVEYTSALTHYGMAKSVWFSIETSKFIEFLSQIQTENMEYNLISQIKSKFDIYDLEKKIERCKDYLGA